MKNFEVNTRITFGENALDRLLALEYRKVMVLADPFVVTSGLIRQVTGRLEQAHIAFTVFDDVVPDPPLDKVIHGVTTALRERPECMIAIGGGSAIDLSKSVRKFATQTEPGFRPCLIAIPTTSGTGSEVTSFAVITDPDKGVKYPLSEDSMIPDEAILDEELVKSVPASDHGGHGDGRDDPRDRGVCFWSTTMSFPRRSPKNRSKSAAQFLLRSYNDNPTTRTPAAKCTSRRAWRGWRSTRRRSA